MGEIFVDFTEYQNFVAFKKAKWVYDRNTLFQGENLLKLCPLHFGYMMRQKTGKHSKNV